MDITPHHHSAALHSHAVNFSHHYNGKQIDAAPLTLCSEADLTPCHLVTSPVLSSSPACISHVNIKYALLSRPRNKRTMPVPCQVLEGFNVILWVANMWQSGRVEIHCSVSLWLSSQIANNYREQREREESWEIQSPANTAVIYCLARTLALPCNECYDECSCLW